MNIAVLVNGVYPANLDREYLKGCVERFNKHFPNCDVYYQTWDTHLNRHIFKDLDINILWIPEPKTFEHNPYNLLVEDKNPIITKGNPFRKRYETIIQSDNETSKKRNWQIYGLALLHRTIKKKYDYYIRTRWDVYFGNYFNIDLFLKQTEINDCVSGLSFQNFLTQSSDRHLPKKWQIILRRTKTKRIVDSEYLSIHEQDSGPYLNHSNHFLYDFIIIYREDDFDYEHTIDLFENEKLMPAEFGWCQVMTKKRKHLNFNGRISILRHVDDSERAYEKSFE